MKPELLALSFLFFAFPLAFSNDAQPVVDEDGNPVVPGTEYFIVPIIIGPPHPGAVTLGISTGNPTCPVTVEVSSKLVHGCPVKLNTPGVSTDEILTEIEVEIEFVKKPKCAESSKWRIFGGSEIEEAYVGIGGPQDHPGQQTIIGRFSIVRSRLGYSLAFCRPINRSPLCSNIGRDLLDEHRSLLVLTGNAASFQFGLRNAHTYSGIRTVV